MLEYLNTNKLKEKENNMKIDRKLIVSKTIMFALILVFINVFKAVFGGDNTLIGVTTITLSLMFLERDLTSHPLKNLIKLIGINVFMGVCAFLVNQNMIIGIFVNFIAVFTIAYIFSYDLRKPMNMMFGLQYVLILTTPVTINQMPLRLVSLAFGATFIMILQMIANKNKVDKIGKKTLIKIEDKLFEKIDLLKENKSIEDINLEINLLVNNLKKAIFDGRKKEFYLCKEGKKIVSILSCLETINTIMDKVVINEVDANFLEDVYNQIKNIKENKFENNMEDLLEKYKDSNIKKIYLYEYISVLGNLFEEMNKEEVEEVIHVEEIPLDFKMIKIQKRKFRINSLRVSYSIRLAILISFSTFVTDYFDLAQGKWLIYTVFSLTQPYFEASHIRAKKRVVGTVVGVVLVGLLFNIIKDVGMRTMIILIVGYLGSYAIDYRTISIAVTMSAICSASLNVDSPNMLIINRVVFVLLGIVLAIIVNRFILPYRAKEAITDVKNLYTSMINTMINETIENLGESKNEHSIKNLFLLPSFIEDRMILINANLEKGEDNQAFLYNHKVLVNRIHQIYLYSKRHRITDMLYKKTVEDLKMLLNGDLENYDEVYAEIESNIQNISSVKDRTLLIKILEVLSSINDINKESVAKQQIYM